MPVAHAHGTLTLFVYSIFTILQIQLACEKCIEDGRAEGCVHLLHLAPRWQSTERHRRLKVRSPLVPCAACRLG